MCDQDKQKTIFPSHREFEVHKLNAIGLSNMQEISNEFNRLMTRLEYIIDQNPENGRLLSIVATKLEEACFFAKKALAVDPQYKQE
jgi:hypothetical protein